MLDLATCLWLAALALPRGARAHLDGDLGELAVRLLALRRPRAMA